MSGADQIAPTGLGRLYRGQTAIDFYGKRKYSLIVAAAMVIITLVSLSTRTLNLGLDFEGGVAWDVPASSSFGVSEAQAVLADNGISTTGAKIQRRSSDANDVITVQIEEEPPETITALTQGFADAASVDVQEVSFSFTSSTWGGEITKKAVRALIIFLVIVSLFISVRFEWRMALAALAAMANDVLFTVGAYSVFGFEVTPATVIAFLTILGYSLYDTIVVFDRVKENEGKFAGVRMRYEDIVNVSMNQVLMRSINTSLSSILPVISLLLIGSALLGAVTLREFGLALLIGMISGVYSSIFIAAPMLAWLKSKSGRRDARRPRLAGEELRALVIGSGVTGRVLTVPAEPEASEEHDEEALAASVAQPAERLLTHPARPRKKKRR
jgi:preprotein translocase subunit SecF